MMKKILDIINKSAGQVTQNYLKLTTTYEPSGIVKERVFCYELYHRLRLVIGDNHELTLNGEIDKRGHRYFEEKDRKNPDFIFHIPGQFKETQLLLRLRANLIFKESSKTLKL